MSNVLYMWEYLQRKQEERIRGVNQKRINTAIALKLEGLRIFNERKKKEILKEAQRLISEQQFNNNDNGGNNAR